MSIWTIIGYIAVAMCISGGIICLRNAIRFAYQPLIIQGIGLLLLSAALVAGQMHLSDEYILVFAIPAIGLLIWFQTKYAAAWKSHRDVFTHHK